MARGGQNFGFIAFTARVAGVQTVTLTLAARRNDGVGINVIGRLGKVGFVRITADACVKGVTLVGAGRSNNTIDHRVLGGWYKVGLIRIVTVLAFP